MASEDAPIILEMLQDVLGRHDEPEHVPGDDVLEQLMQPERDKVAKWVEDCHFEVSDNLIHAGPMPVILREFVPEDHAYRTWRVE
jgi:hypothetical protein